MTIGIERPTGLEQKKRSEEPNPSCAEQDKEKCSEEPDSPCLVLITQIQLDGAHHDRCVGIGSELKGKIRREIITFLKRNKSTFAWTTEDMPGISIDVASDQLNVDPSFKPVKQNWRKLGPNRAKE